MNGLKAKDILARIEGWQGATYEELPGGLNNKTYKVVMGAQHAVLKVDQSSRDDAFNSRHAEARIQARAADSGLAAEVLAFGDHYYLTNYLDGDVWGRKQLRDDASLGELAAALKKVHALPLVGRTFDATAASQLYAKRVQGLESQVVELCLSLVGGIRKPHNLCCCHNDLVAENIISTPTIMFLDWEYACDNDPFFDLATLVEHHDLNDEQAVGLLDAYFGGGGEPWLGNLETYRGLYLALLCLWTASRDEGALTDAAYDLKWIVERILTRYS